jgi:dihydrofolate reductase
MKLITNTQITVDGVMQANGGNNPVFDPGFDRGGWALPLGEEESEAYIGDFYQRADAFLFGRRTYELFAGYWGVRDDFDSPFVSSLNSRPKYVASNTISDPQWADTTVLSGDLEAAIRELKAKPGGELQVHGSGQLIRWLLQHELVDEMTLIVFPVIVGGGARLFPDAGRDFALDLVESRTFPTGILAQVYRPAGRPEYA